MGTMEFSKETHPSFHSFQDLSLYVNEVKRDHEALQLIEEIQDRYVKSKKDGKFEMLSVLLELESMAMT